MSPSNPTLYNQLHSGFSSASISGHEFKPPGVRPAAIHDLRVPGECLQRRGGRKLSSVDKNRDSGGW